MTNRLGAFRRDIFSLPEMQPTQEVEPQPEASDQWLPMDMVDSFQMGAGQATAGLFDFLGADETAQSIEAWAEGQRSQMSQAGQDALNMEWVRRDAEGNLEAGDGVTDLRSWAMNFANVAGQFAPSLVGTKGLDKLASSTRLGGLGRVGQTVSYAAIGGASGTGQAEMQAKGVIDSTDDETLAKSPLAVELFQKQTDETLSVEDRVAQVRTMLKDRVETEVKTDPRVLAVNFAGSAIADPVIGRAFSQAISTSGRRAFAEGFIKEGATEAAQEAIQTRSINEAVSPVDGRDLNEGVVENALTAGLLGSAFGGATTGASTRMFKDKTPADRKPVEDVTGSEELDQAINDLDNADIPELEDGALDSPAGETLETSDAIEGDYLGRAELPAPSVEVQAPDVGRTSGRPTSDNVPSVEPLLLSGPAAEGDHLGRAELPAPSVEVQAPDVGPREADTDGEVDRPDKNALPSNNTNLLRTNTDDEHAMQAPPTGIRVGVGEGDQAARKTYSDATEAGRSREALGLAGERPVGEPDPRGARGGGQEAGRSLGRDADIAVTGETSAADDKFLTEYASVETISIPTGLDRITTPEEAAHVIAPIRKFAQENSIALVTDSEGNVLNLIRYSVGTKNSAPNNTMEVAAAIAATEGATSVWLGHQHPSGSLTLSDGDKAYTEAVDDALDGSGVEVKGHLVVAPNARKARYFGARHGGYEVDITPAPRRSSIPMTERKLRKTRVDSMDVVAGPKGYMALAKRVGGDNAIILLDHGQRPIGSVNMSPSELKRLREGGRVDRILSAIHKSNAARFVIKTDDAEAAENVSKMLNNIDPESVLDWVSTDLYGQKVSSKDRAGRTHTARGVFYRRDGRRVKIPMSRQAIDRQITRFKDRFKGAEDVKVRVVDSKADLPDMGLPERERVPAFFDASTNEVTLIASDLLGAKEVSNLLMHEVVAHYGLRNLIPKSEYDQVVKAILATRGKDKALDQIWRDSIDRNYKGESDQVKAEELIAHLAETMHDTSTLGRAFDQVVAAVKRALRQIGLLDGDATSEIEVRDLVHSLARGLAKGETSPESVSASGDDVLFKKETESEPTVEEKIGQGPKPQAETVIDKVRNFSLREYGARMREGVFDGLAGVNRAEQDVLGNEWSFNRSGYASARLATGVADVMTAISRYGAPEWRDGVIQHKEGTKGLGEVFEALGEDLNDWLGWMAAHRAENLMAQGLENNLTTEDIAELKSRAEGKEDKFQQAKKDYNAMHSAVLDLAQEAGLIDPTARNGKPEKRNSRGEVTQEATRPWDEEWYVPFYRDADPEGDEVGVFTSPYTQRGLSGQSAQVKKLLGSKLPTKDLLENILTRQLKFVDAAMKNRAMVEIVGNLDGSKYLERVKATDTVKAQVRARKTQYVTALVDGKTQYYKVHDPAVLRGLLQVGTPRNIESIPHKLARDLKQILTIGVTASPDFMVRNWVRDAAHAWTINKDGFTLGVDSVKGVKNALDEDADYKAMMFAGASFQGGYVHGSDPEAAADLVRRQVAKTRMSDSEKKLYQKSITTIQNAWEQYRAYGDKIENASRISTYKASKSSGKDIKQSMFDSKDLMDFSLQGNFATVQLLADVLPFFNARLQGLYKLARAAKAEGGEKAVFNHVSGQMLKHGMIIAAASVALAHHNEDDERYKELPDWDKDGNWHIFVGDNHFRVPKPFEVGVMFGTIPERLLLASGETQDGEDLRGALVHALASTFSLNPTPQIVKPALEAVLNKDMFRDRPIDGMGDMLKEAGQRSGRNTSDLFKLVGEQFNVSPKRLEHVWRGYTGTLGGYVLSVSDMMVRAATDAPSKPTLRARDVPVLKSFYRDSSLPADSTSYGDKFYEMLQASSEAHATYRHFLETGRHDKAKAYREEKRLELTNRKGLSRVQRQLSALNKQLDVVSRSSMSPDKKRRRISEIQRKKNQLTAKATDRFDG